MNKCTCEFCRFPSTGVALDVVAFVDQVPAKRQMLTFLRDSFVESDEGKKAQGYAENSMGILLGEWGLGKTQLLKYFRTAINNSAGVLEKLVGELEDDERVDRVKSLDLTRVMDELEDESHQFEQERPQYEAVFADYRGVAFRIDATKFRNEWNPGENVLLTLWNLVLHRSGLGMKVASDDQIRSATKTILDHFGAHRLFIFFDELEGLQAVETAGFEFGAFFHDFALQVKRILDNEVTADVSMLLAVIPSVWTELMRRFETLGALESRSMSIDLKRLDLKRTYQMIRSRCGTLENAPFSRGAVRTLLRASADNPRYLARICRRVQSDLAANPTAQYRHVLKHLGELPESSRKHYTFDQKGLDELLDGALQEFPDDDLHMEVVRVLAGEINEVSPYELRAVLGVDDVTVIKDALEDLCSSTLAGIYAATRVMKLDTRRIRMSSTQVAQQRKHLEDVGWLAEEDFQIEGQRLKIWNLEYERDILRALATYVPDSDEHDYYLPVSETRTEELSMLWRLEKTGALTLARTLQALGKTDIQKYRLSHTAMERVFPWHGAKEPPFEWVPETYWHDAHAHLHDARTPKEEMRELLMDGLLGVAKSMQAKCSKLDRECFRMELMPEFISNYSYDDEKSVSCLVAFVTEESEIGADSQKRRIAEQSADFLVVISTTRLRQKPASVETQEGRPTIEVVYYEIDGKTQFKLQLLAYLNRTATDQTWYVPDKWLEASNALTQSCLGNVMDLWLHQIDGNGYLVNAWELDEASVKEPRRPLRAIRDTVSIIPGLPVQEVDFDVELRRAGARDKMDPVLFELLKANLQIVQQASGRVGFNLLPTQQRIIELAPRIKPEEGEEPEDSAARIRKYFWRGRHTNIERELTRHITTVESLGYFDPGRDVDALIYSIRRDLEQVLEEEDGATIDQYAYQIRHSRGDIGAKRAQRLQDELAYYVEHYERYRDQIRVLEKHPEWLIPRVIRRRLIEISRDAGEIIAVGKPAFDQGKSAVAQAERDLRTAHYNLTGRTDIQIQDHVRALKDYARHPLLEDARQAHREGRVHDEKKEQKGAIDFLAEIREKLTTLREEKKQVESDIQCYSDTYKLVSSRAKALSNKKGAAERLAPLHSRLDSLDPNTMRTRLKKTFEGAGLRAGEKEIRRAERELEELQNELEDIEAITDDLAALEDVVDSLERARERGEKLLKRASSSEADVFSERHEWLCIKNDLEDFLKRVTNWRGTYQALRQRYDASKDHARIEAGQRGNSEFQEEIGALERGFGTSQQGIQELDLECQQIVGILEQPVPHARTWSNGAMQRVSALWIQRARMLIHELFAASSLGEFEALLREDRDLRQHMISASNYPR